MNVEKHFTDGICTALVLDLTKLKQVPADIADLIHQSHQDFIGTLAADLQKNRNFEPLLLVFGKNMTIQTQESAQQAGAFVIDIGLPGHKGKTPADFLREMDEAMRVQTPDTPMATTVPDADPSIYYKPMSDDEPERLKQFFALLNASNNT